MAKGEPASTRKWRYFVGMISSFCTLIYVRPFTMCWLGIYTSTNYVSLL